ncbi:SDR family oxidoreductase [Solirubrobacter sp. CPCC 204708]|uniref:SDR family oxidoreductase n=1 Tax=Solirubrobacter deserti TaxID=2282478 RepID=A0ABT4RDD2_9ACTN|nr:SDR family oxidoreductase [Solirubrobacter deserti]MBE2314515.1 SDR family oxidoreductase [Solirubrobacter deserti]MDA0136520.1 SDR family oxidoreductase [Solirubrobacter deserti]
MRFFVTGASGWIGSAVVPELLQAGHEVVGLARSDASAERIAALGAAVRRGGLDDLDGLAAGAAESDGVVHLGYNHDFSRMAEAAQTDLAAVTAMGAALEGSDRPLLIASGTLGLAPGRVATEADDADPASHPRIATAQAALAMAERGVRSIVVRFAPTVHGSGDPGFVSVLVKTALESGVSGYVGDGSNRWPAVHRLDAARLVRLAMEGAPAGSVLHATAEDGVPAIQIAEAIGRALGLETASVAPEHFDWLGQFFAADIPASSALTRERLAWEPAGPGLIEELEAGVYSPPETRRIAPVV